MALIDLQVEQDVVCQVTSAVGVIAGQAMTGPPFFAGI